MYISYLAGGPRVNLFLQMDMLYLADMHAGMNAHAAMDIDGGSGVLFAWFVGTRLLAEQSASRLIAVQDFSPRQLLFLQTLAQKKDITQNKRRETHITDPRAWRGALIAKRSGHLTHRH
jgi:hypothetical protein